MDGKERVNVNKLYYCNHSKNKGCKKNSCFIKTGPCHLTKDEQYKAKGIRLFIMRYLFSKEDDFFNNVFK